MRHLSCAASRRLSLVHWLVCGFYLLACECGYAGVGVGMRERGCPGLAARASASAHSLPSCIEPHTRTSPPPSQPPFSLSLSPCISPRRCRGESLGVHLVTGRPPTAFPSTPITIPPHPTHTPPSPLQHGAAHWQHTCSSPFTSGAASARLLSERASRSPRPCPSSSPPPLLPSNSPPPLKLPSYPAYRSVSALQTRTALPIAPFAGASAGTWLASVSGISLVTCPLDLTLIALRWQTNHSRAYQS